MTFQIATESLLINVKNIYIFIKNLFNIDRKDLGNHCLHSRAVTIIFRIHFESKACSITVMIESQGSH